VLLTVNGKTCRGLNCGPAMDLIESSGQNVTVRVSRSVHNSVLYGHWRRLRGGGQRGTVPRKLEVEGTEVLISPPTFLKYHYKFTHFLHSEKLNPLMGTGNYSATSNNMKLVHWQLMGGLLHLVQR